MASLAGAGQGGSDIVRSNVGGIYLAPTAEAFTYDADGNLTQDGRWTYTWDAENRLIQMQTATTAASAGAPNLKLEFAYDSGARRIQKRLMEWNGSTYAPVYTNRYIYNGWQILGVLTGGAIQESYVFGLGDSRKSETGNVLFSFGDSVSDDYVVYDGLGHVVGIVASSTGKMRSEWEYDVFGGVVKTGRYLGKLLYSSKYHDLETGLIYFGYRYYSPQNGRWINRDLIEEKGGVNVHALAKNDGLNYFDSLGLKINMINEGIDDYLSVRGVTGYQRDQSDLQYVYSGGEVRYGGLVAEILSAMIKSGRQFRFYCRKDLELHVRARVNTVNYVIEPRVTK